MERLVMVAYRPKPGERMALADLVRRHHACLDAEGLVSPRKPVAMTARDGTIIEIFGWKSAQAIDAAHANPAVQELWQQFAQVCDYVPVADVAEAHAMFSEFTPLP
ncbi:MAG: hypothetical protein EP335_18565 [Alphaproteobacteria bacterium]|nr:MAG: hypothetical protein EP335_18565 [Alphaproteobacteria bacterium]